MLKAKQQYAFDTMKSGKNCFLSGDAGTGKSHVVNEYIEYCNKKNLDVVITAPTGIAALNINGVTAHRAFNIPIGPVIEPVKSLPSILRDADVVILDEVSMCRMDAFEYIVKIIVGVNKYRRKCNKEDLQFIVVGDFFQLPPVLVENEREILEQHYNKKIGYAFAFQSPLWQACNFVNIVLDEVVRQDDKEFVANLNGARLGKRSSISYFSKVSARNEIENAILLCGTNKAVLKKNEEELEKIKSKLVEYESIITGEVRESDKMVPDIIQLKVGARVMTVVNDIEDRYRNGSFGTVVKLNENSVIVKLDTGLTVEITRYQWKVQDYKLAEPSNNGKKDDKPSKLTQQTIGIFEQFPLKLAYAITIHKSQGQTYDAVNLNPYCWDCGQLYVALSRVRDAKNMHLTQPIKDSFLRASKEVINFYNSL